MAFVFRKAKLVPVFLPFCHFVTLFSNCKKQNMGTFKIGCRVEIIDTGSPYYLLTGHIIGINQKDEFGIMVWIEEPDEVEGFNETELRILAYPQA